eukprot:TRINITY_DN7850_c0_g1_i1.p2 TRINITY_DN7850_c0_g1~~TRINITY_DN7850_c0_g1_i1.p2  ORF type:complete len:157 (-),score=40.25 TRINITY_DN7850_c0_g1_i1:343-813(-)
MLTSRHNEIDQGISRGPAVTVRQSNNDPVDIVSIDVSQTSMPPTTPESTQPVSTMERQNSLGPIWKLEDGKNKDIGEMHPISVPVQPSAHYARPPSYSFDQSIYHTHSPSQLSHQNSFGAPIGVHELDEFTIHVYKPSKDDQKDQKDDDNDDKSTT